jgi:nucleoid-associated protein YgaU
MTDQLQHALVTLEEADADTVAEELGVEKDFVVQFNPTEYGLEKSNSYAEITIPGLDSPLLQFANGNSETLNFELLFDVTTDAEVEDVRERTRNLAGLARIVPSTHAPPRIRVAWGSLDFKAVVESVSEQFTLFSPDGKPLRSRLSLALKRYYPLAEQLKALKLQSADHSKSWEVRRGDRLDRIAAATYGDPARWRLIAEEPANREVLRDPRRLVPGTVLRLPPEPRP